MVRPALRGCQDAHIPGPAARNWTRPGHLAGASRTDGVFAHKAPTRDVARRCAQSRHPWTGCAGAGCAGWGCRTTTRLGAPGEWAAPQEATMPEFVAAIDQGTTSTRCMIFDHDGREIGRHQLEHRQIMERPGWVEHDPA